MVDDGLCALGGGSGGDLARAFAFVVVIITGKQGGAIQYLCQTACLVVNEGMPQPVCGDVACGIQRDPCTMAGGG